MNTGSTVWVYPHGSPDEAAPATVDLLSSIQRSIALRLLSKPRWCRIGDGVRLNRAGFHIEMFLTRESVGPWIELTNGGHYEIDEAKPV